jgi:hypothetical protein
MKKKIAEEEKEIAQKIQDL